MSKAYLILPVATSGSPSSTFEITVTRLTRGYQSQLGESITRSQKNYYPIRIKETDFSFTIQCTSVAQYDTIKKTIAIAQRLALVSVEKGFSRFSYPELNIDYLGLINFSPEGAARFQYTPELTVNMITVKDTINTQTTQYSALDGSWQDIYGSSVVNLDDYDSILAGSRPSSLYDDLESREKFNNPTRPGSTNNGDRQAFE